MTSCGEAPGARSTGPDVEAVRARHGAFAAALDAKRAAAVAAFYDIGVPIIEPERRGGRLAVGVALDNKELLADPLAEVALGYPEIEVSGGLAVSQCECSFTRTNPETRRREVWFGYCMHAWRRGADGTWRIGWESRNVLPAAE